MKEKKLSSAQKFELASEIIRFLIEHELWFDTNIYTDGYCFSSNKRSNYEQIDGYSEPVWKSKTDDIKPTCEYANENTLTMTFEGPLYEVLNYCLDMEYCDKLTKEFNAILEKYKMYYEQGHEWSLSLYFD